MSDITDLRAWHQRRQEAAQQRQEAAPPAPGITFKASIVEGCVQLHIEDAYVALNCPLTPEDARALASMLLCHAAVAESKAGLQARRFHLQRRKGGYEVWLCQGASRSKRPVPELLPRRDARTWAMVYAALNGWPYLEGSDGDGDPA